MPTYFTANRHGYAVRFSKFSPDRLIVAASQFYGLVGAGTLYVLDLIDDEENFLETKTFQWSDGLFDVVCSEKDPNIVISVSGDGTLQLWNLESMSDDSPLNNLPQMIYKEHRKEVYSIDWVSVRSDNFILSASWDCTIKIWDPNSTTSLCTYAGHSKLVYNAMFSPLIPNTFASVSADGYLKIWNMFNKDRPIASLKSHDGEILTCDWCKYDQNILATGSSDGLIRGYDIRHFGVPMFELKGCDYAVRKIQFSPFDISTIASVGFDYYTRIWDFNRTNEPLESIKQHTEFAYGLDWNPLRRNQLADCGWDSLVNVFYGGLT
ncbi:CLUMA_CG009542, isoform A [Clunio marinus]|uniref:Peroxin-7 n=1 Tax=Clunio marinus TaxID=568069 RepID=A0A1J1I7F5_9DIPT|nr:CLUMA_CG009542, isoform A [Clunio marinus]